MISVLFIDDEPALCDIGRLYLERSKDITVDTTISAFDALEKLKKQRYDAIVSDYQIAELDGIALLKLIHRQYGDIPFILFTGKGREEVAIEALNNGADFYLQKGGDPKAQFVELEFKGSCKNNLINLGMYRVVPFPMEGVSHEIDRFHFLIGDLNPFGIKTFV